MKRGGGFAAFLLHVHPRWIPESSSRFTYTGCFGGLTLWMFVIEIATGALLAFYYIPSPAGAYASVQDITHAIPYGFFVRNLHYWGGQAMVILVLLHTGRVFLTGAFAPPRSFNWLIGLLLLVGTFFVDFTGYLLVWDDRALWARVIAANLANTAPLFGEAVGALLFGPECPPELALTRVYVWHVLLTPAAIILGAAWHFWRIRKDGGISRPL